MLDLSPTAHQPMATPDGQLVIVFNGEIYNYLELRRELQAHGHSFRSTGDTEVLLYAYRQWGAACLDRLNGMWAFVLFERRRSVVFGARDRFGMKPLFVHRAKSHYVIASEIKAITASGMYEPSPNRSLLSRFLFDGALDESEQTFFAGIEQLPASTAFELDLRGAMRRWRYWSLDADGGAIADPPSSFAELFEDAVRKHMRSDVPVAVNLSGGLDSTSIICAAARARNGVNAGGPLMAFSYMTEEFDERPYISATVAQAGARLIPLDTNATSLWDDVRQALWLQDEPMHSLTTVIGYQLMRLAKNQGIRVVLNGQGADETIGGYDNYFSHYWQSFLNEGRVRDTWQGHDNRNSLALFLNQIVFASRLLARRLRAYRQIGAWRRQAGRARNRWFTRELIGAYAEPSPRYQGVDLDFGAEALARLQPTAVLSADLGPKFGHTRSRSGCHFSTIVWSACCSVFLQSGSCKDPLEQVRLATGIAFPDSRACARPGRQNGVCGARFQVAARKIVRPYHGPSRQPRGARERPLRHRRDSKRRRALPAW